MKPCFLAGFFYGVKRKWLKRVSIKSLSVPNCRHRLPVPDDFKLLMRMAGKKVITCYDDIMNKPTATTEELGLCLIEYKQNY